MPQDNSQTATHRHSMDKFELAVEPNVTSTIGEQILLDVHYTAEEEKKVVRKIDCVVLPLVSQAMNTFGLQSDKATDVFCVLLPVSGQAELELCFGGRSDHRSEDGCISILVVLEHLLYW